MLRMSGLWEGRWVVDLEVPNGTAYIISCAYLVSGRVGG